MKFFKLALRGLIYLLVIILFSIIYTLLVFYGVKETVHPIVGIVAMIVLVWVPCYLLTDKIMEHVKID